MRFLVSRLITQLVVNKKISFVGVSIQFTVKNIFDEIEVKNTLVGDNPLIKSQTQF